MRQLSFVLLSALLCAGASSAAARPGPESAHDTLPVDLSTALRLAGTQNLQIAEAEARAREAGGEALSAWERFFPSLAAEWLLSRHEGRTQATDGSFLDVDKQSHRAGVHLSATWDLSNALFNALAARRRADAASRRSDVVTDSALLMVGLVYLDLALATEQVRVNTRAAGVSADLVDQTRRSIDAGIGYEIDLVRARALSAHDLVVLHRAQVGIGVASTRLAELLNLDIQTVLAPIDTVVVALQLIDTSGRVDQWIEAASRSHPVLQSASAELATARWEKHQAVWGSLLPEFRAQALATGLGPTLGDLRRSQDYTVSARWTLGPGGLFDLGRIHSRSARATGASIRYDRARIAISAEIVRLHSELQQRGATLSIARDGLADARRALALAEDRRRIGVGLALEAINAAEALQRAEEDYAREVVDYNRIQLRLLAALGRLTPGRFDN